MRKNQCKGDEADVDDDQIERTGGIVGLKEPCVEIFDKGNVVTGSQFPRDEAFSDVERGNVGCAVFEKGVGEATGGGADVEGHEAGGIDVEMVESAIEFETATGDVGAVGFEQCNLDVKGDPLAGLDIFVTVHEDVAGHDSGLRARP